MIKLMINGRFLAQRTTGVQRVAREIMREIDDIVSQGESDFSVTLACQPQAVLEDLNLKAIHVRRIGGLAGQAWEQTSLPMAARGSVLLCLGNSAPIASLVAGGVVGVMVHDMSYRIYPDAYRSAYRTGHSILTPLILRYANPIITVSETERMQLAGLKRSLFEDVVVAQNGGWCGEHYDVTGSHITVEPGYLLYVGALTRRKNLQGLLEAAVRLAREDRLRTIIVGAVSTIHTEVSLKLDDDVRDKITFVGQVEDAATLAYLYSNAACLVFPSLYEASPLPPIEAMHFGCPVVVSDIAALRERCGNAAEYCDPSSTDSIVSAVRNVVSHPERSKELAGLGQSRAKLFSWRAQTLTVLDALRRVVAERGVG